MHLLNDFSWNLKRCSAEPLLGNTGIANNVFILILSITINPRFDWITQSPLYNAVIFSSMHSSLQELLISKFFLLKFFVHCWYPVHPIFLDWITLVMSDKQKNYEASHYETFYSLLLLPFSWVKILLVYTVSVCTTRRMTKDTEACLCSDPRYHLRKVFDCAAMGLVTCVYKRHNLLRHGSCVS
jgi:hypothetical protein